MTTDDALALRSFRVWLYTVGHSSLLLRSTPTETAPTRFDVLFKGVRAAHIPDTQHIVGVSIHPAAPIPAEPRLKEGEMLYRFGSGWVIAVMAFAHEDHGDYGDPSAFDVFAPPGISPISG